MGEAGDLNSGEIEELAKLRAELPVRLQIIAPAMAGYGVAEQRRDQELFGLGKIFYAPISDHEEAQARIRITFFALSPEGLGRARLSKLQDHYISYWLTPAEKAELAHLEATYPEVPWNENTWQGRIMGAWARSKKESIENESQRQKERAKTNPRYR